MGSPREWQEICSVEVSKRHCGIFLLHSDTQERPQDVLLSRKPGFIVSMWVCLLEKEISTHSSILSARHSTGSQEVRLFPNRPAGGAAHRDLLRAGGQVLTRVDPPTPEKGGTGVPPPYQMEPGFPSRPARQEGRSPVSHVPTPPAPPPPRRRRLRNPNPTSS